MPKLHLVEGPVGSGKSTFAKSLALQTNGVHIPLDEWFSRLFSPDRPEVNLMLWYAERKKRLHELIWSHARDILASGTDAILELGLIERQARIEFCQRVSGEGAELVVHVLDLPREIRRERVRRRNIEKGPTFSMVVPDPFFEIASNMWEAPDEAECSDFAVQFVSTS